MDVADINDVLGSVEMTELEKNADEYARYAKQADLILMPLNGGIGSAIERKAGCLKCCMKYTVLRPMI